MEAIILAGGMGTRLRSVVSDVPKPMAPVNGRPFLDIILQQLDGMAAIDRVVLAIGYMAEVIKAQYADTRKYRYPIEFSVESSPLGTAGALRQALSGMTSENVLLLNGDSYVDFDIYGLRQFHAERKAVVSMVVVEVEDSARYGVVTVDPQTGRVLGFSEKTDRHVRGLINAGCYLLRRNAFLNLSPTPASFEKDVLPLVLPSTYAFRASGRFIDIGVPESYFVAGDYLR